MKFLFVLFFPVFLIGSCNQEPLVSEEKELTIGLESRQKDPGKKKDLEMCHLENNGEYKVIPVKEKDLAKRIANGDYLLDADGDGFTAVDACSGSRDDSDDTNPAINPEAAEICNNMLDDDSDGLSDCDDPDCTESCATCPCFILEDLNCDSFNIFNLVCDLGTSILIKSECFKLIIGEDELGQKFVSFSSCYLVITNSEYDACSAIARQAILDFGSVEYCAPEAKTTTNLKSKIYFDQNKIRKKQIPSGSN